jgi:hypothetical protein
MRRFVAAAGFCLVAGCGGPVDPDAVAVRLVAEEAVVTENAVTLRLVNASNGTVSYNLCSSSLQRHTASAWVSAERGRTCFSIAYGLSPRSQTTERRALQADLPAGRYRIATEVEWSEKLRLPLWSNTFEVR